EPHEISIPNHESEVVEFKSAFNDEVIASLVAFANTKGGTVFVGVNDAGEVKGVGTGKETVAVWVNEIKNKTAPIIIPDVEELLIAGKNVVLLSIDEYPLKPVSFKGRYYKRVKNSNHTLTASEVVDLHLKSV